MAPFLCDLSEDKESEPRDHTFFGGVPFHARLLEGVARFGAAPKLSSKLLSHIEQLLAVDFWIVGNPRATLAGLWRGSKGTTSCTSSYEVSKALRTSS